MQKRLNNMSYSTAAGVKDQFQLLARSFSLRKKWWLFSSHTRNCGKIFDESIPARTFFFFFKVELSSSTPIPLSKPGSVDSGRLSELRQLWLSVPDELGMSSYPWKVPTLCLDSIVSPHRLHRVKDVSVFTCDLPPALFAEWLKSLTCHCGNMGWNGRWTRVITES